jgi:DNA-directed RNA polymerase specialized sigma24 family protein
MLGDSQLPASLTEVARRCHEETERFFRRLVHDTQYCYELFRRALAQRNGDAFELLILNYRSLVDGWVRRHPRFGRTGEDVELFANTAFERLWIAIPPASFGRFPDLRSLLRYLQMCAHCSVADYVRATELTVSLEPDDPDAPVLEPAAAEPTLSHAEKAEIWRAVVGEMRTEKERIVVQCGYALEMKPGEIYEDYPNVFASVQEVYRTKQNVLERLRRNEALRKFLAPYA